MITDKDVAKLRRTFVTKEDAKKFATKKDLAKFATKKDLEKFATKKELATVNDSLEKKIDNLDFKVEYMAGRILRLEDCVDVMDDKLDHIMISMDRIAENYDTLRLENGAGGLVLSRHTRQLETLSAGTGIALSD